MMAEAYSHWPYGVMSGAAMLLFIGVFAGISYRAFGPGSSRRYSSARELPLADLKPIANEKEGR
jgi:cbb3-type cytochrome oxidase subunit 3